MAGWEPATKEQQNYLAVLQEKARVTRHIQETGALTRNQISAEIDKIRVELGEIEPGTEEDDDNIIQFPGERELKEVQKDKEMQPWEIANQLERNIFEQMARVCYENDDLYAKHPFREPMDLHSNGTFITVWKKYPNIHRREAVWDLPIAYGWRWICRHPIHKYPVHGGSALGFTQTLENAIHHRWKRHRGK